MSQADTYTYTKACANCGTITRHIIPKGTTVDSFLGRAVCKNCGCPVTKSFHMPYGYKPAELAE